MHKKLINEATFYLTISVEGPLLVKSGTETWDPAVPDMQFVRTRDAQFRETVFIPGSSLKGTLRSYSEKIARTLNVSCCDPFDQDLSCRAKLEKFGKENNASEIYKGSCAACKLYGSTNMAGRAAFADAYLTERLDAAKQLTKRTAVAIDRVLGSVAVGPFDFEALIHGEFTTQIRLHNFELWQLGLLGLAIRDLCLGRIRVGYGKSRGFGSVSAKLARLELRSIANGGLNAADGKLTVKGIGALTCEEERRRYGIDESEPISVATTITPIADWLATSVIFERSPDATDWFPSPVDALLGQCVKSAWKRYTVTHQANGEKRG
jgi:CRISPR-associated protein Csm3